MALGELRLLEVADEIDSCHVCSRSMLRMCHSGELTRYGSGPDALLNSGVRSKIERSMLQIAVNCKSLEPTLTRCGLTNVAESEANSNKFAVNCNREKCSRLQSEKTHRQFAVNCKWERFRVANRGGEDWRCALSLPGRRLVMSEEALRHHSGQR
jgi:hypothetical protein